MDPNFNSVVKSTPFFSVREEKEKTVMKPNKKLKEKIHEIEPKNTEYCPTDPSYSPSKKNKKKNIKSKGKQVAANKSKKSGSICRKRTRYCDLYEDIEARFNVMERADRVLARLGDDFPFFMKAMLLSNVARGFWMHLPAKFCEIHLPREDTTIWLVDEWGNEYKTSYLLERHGLSAGWRNFSITHRLLQGDVLIFHLIESNKLKVHIVRVSGLDAINAALGLVKLSDASGIGENSANVKKANKKRKKIAYVDLFTPDLSTPENVKATTLEPDLLVLEGPDVTNRPQPKDFCYPETSFMRDHSREVLTCR